MTNRLYPLWPLCLLFFACGEEQHLCFEDHPNGTRKYEVPCDEWSGDYNGEMKVFDEEGNLIRTTIFVENVEEDTSRFFTPDGRIFRKIPMEHGEIHGRVTEYHPDGSLAMETTFEQGIPQGEYKTYFPGGTRLKELRTYVDGRQKGPYKRFYENGNPEVEGEYIMSLKVGKWIRYRPDGGMLSAFTMYLDQRQGGFGVFKPSGLPYLTGEFTMDEVDGEVRFFNDDGAIIRKEFPKTDWYAEQTPENSGYHSDRYRNIIMIPVEENKSVYISGDSAWIVKGN